MGEAAATSFRFREIVIDLICGKEGIAKLKEAKLDEENGIGGFTVIPPPIKRDVIAFCYEN